MLNIRKLTNKTAVANISGAMEADTILKNGRNSKSQTSRSNVKIMFKMQRIMFLFVAMLFVALPFGSVNAQGTITIGGSEGNIGLRAGLNLAKIAGDYDDLYGDMKFKPGIQLGVVVEFATNNDNLFIQPGILFSQMGFKYEEFDSEPDYGDIRSYSYTLQQNLNYFQIPVNFLFKHDMGGNKLILQAGPYLGYGLGGKWEEEDSESWGGSSGTNAIDKESGKIKFGSSKNKDHYKSFDLGLGLGVGLEFSEIFQIGVGYNLGIADISHINNFEVKNRSITFTLTYVLGR